MPDRNLNTKAKILVVGDVMLDQYWHGDANRVSPEAPVPVVRLSEVENRIGGAGNVAANIASLGGRVKLLSVVGNDKNAEKLYSLLNQQGVNTTFIKIDGHTTTNKLRIISNTQQLLRVDSEKILDLNRDKQQLLLNKFSELLGDVDVVVFSDYAKGVVSNIEQLITVAKSKNVTVVVDPKSQDFSIYAGADVITPNLKEFEAFAGICSTDQQLGEKALQAIEKLKLTSIVVTKGSKGVTVVEKNKKITHMLSTSSEVYDVTGAGDTVIGTLSYFIAAGLDLLKSTTFANYAAGIVVSKSGTSVVNIAELKEKTKAKIKISTGLVPEKTLIELIKECQSRGEKIVFTNGCYDVIHYGHIRYLEKAKSFGDRLVVGINTDCYIKKSKGSSRPVNNLQSRMEVLAGIKSVDWVVPFAEDTPGELVKKLNPDVLIKTAENYNCVTEVPASEGATHVLDNGGKIYLVGRTKDCSSTDIIEKLNLEETTLT